MNLPNKYKWLLTEPGPKMLLEFIKIYGVYEAPGDADNPVILKWAKECGIKNYQHDETPWCGLEMAVIAKRAEKEVNFDPLWALNWAKFGVKVKEPMLGDVLVFKRNGGGHVGLYIGEDDECYHVGGGNQSNKSNIVRKEKMRLFVARRPIYKVQPGNVRKIFLTEDGDIDTNEQ